MKSLKGKQFLILACQGAELQTVKKGLLNSDLLEKILPLPVGMNAVTNLLKQKDYNQCSIVLIGLAGSLSPAYQVGDVVIYQSCTYQQDNQLQIKYCDSQLNNYLQNKLNAPLIKALTTDKLIHSQEQKLALNKLSDSVVVDMETYAVMNYFSSVSVIRIISDNCNDDLPNLNDAITLDGKLDNLKMAMAFIKKPIKAIKLIKNALKSLKVLEEVTGKIFDD